MELAVLSQCCTVYCIFVLYLKVHIHKIKYVQYEFIEDMDVLAYKTEIDLKITLTHLLHCSFFFLELLGLSSKDAFSEIDF